MAKSSKRTAKTPASSAAAAGGRSLVIVESPAKAKTINKYLGNRYVVRASRGHVRDLPPGSYGIDPGRNFEPAYEILPSHKKVIDELKTLADQADMVYLATDLDREGEAIAWHLAAALNLPEAKIQRVIFNEITKSAITEAFNHPHQIDIDKVNAQQARRILDRVVGYELSPLLWKKIAKGLSAGRVQSVAVRIIVDREKQIRAFQPEEYWAINPVFAADAGKAPSLSQEWNRFLADKSHGPDGPSAEKKGEWLGGHGCFRAELVEMPKPQPFRPTGKVAEPEKGEYRFESAVEDAISVARALGCDVEEISRQARKEYPHFHQIDIALRSELDHNKAPRFLVRSLETKRRSTRPSGPFTTAALQQAAANQLRFAAARTMKTAQALYEGLDLKDGQGNIGLITYMRTDSTNLSNESVHAARSFIKSSYGPNYVPDAPQRYGSAKNAQEAHEAIRPTDVARTPDSLRGHMTDEQFKLYSLIWNRFVACQMKAAEWDTTALIEAEAPDGVAVFKAAGRVLVFDGFYRVMGLPEGDQLLPPLKEGRPVAPIELAPLQKYTNPPPRFTEASLVKELESLGIGRPSTYAAIIETIQSRGYVEQVDRRFHTTSRGEIVTDQLVEHFPKIMDVQFTNFMEQELDKIEEAHHDWVHVLHEFYDPFKEALAKAHEGMERIRAEASPYTCEKCGKPMVYRLGKNGRFLSCTGYPECKAAKNIDRDGNPIEPIIGSDPCELCGKEMMLRKSRSGPFLGCTGYPDCSNTKPCDEQGVALKKIKPEELKIACAECGSPMGVRFAKGRSFLGCSKYPQCKATAQLPPGVYIEKPKPESAGVGCDKCGRPMVIRKSRRGPFLSCSGFPRCRNAMPMEKIDHLKSLAAEGKIPAAPAPDAKGARGKSATSSRGRAKAAPLSKTEIAALPPPPTGFAWTRTGRPVVENWPPGDTLKCFDCSGEMTMRTGRFGPFFACAKCKAVANLRGEAKKKAEAASPSPERAKPIETDVACPDCNSKMLLRMGRTGRFLGCSAYPKCKKTMEVPPGLLREVGAELAGSSA